MPTILPRITITLDIEEYAVLARVSELQGRPMSRIVVELLREMTPGLRRMADTMELALEARESVTRSLRRAVAEADPVAAEFMKHLQDLERDRASEESLVLRAMAAEEADAGKRSAAVASLPGSDPRPVITGVRKPQRRTKAAKDPGKNPAKRRA